MSTRGAWVYLMANRYRGTTYIGMSADLPRRITQHREGAGSIFVAEHSLTRLVHAEHFERIDEAIAREKALKK